MTKKYDIRNVHILIETAALLWIIIAVGVCLWVNLQNVNFWVDEAMLAYSVSNRSIWELAASPLAWNQSTPLFYIYIVKLISIVLGNNEFTLRLCSLLAYCFLLLAFWYLAKRVLHHQYPVLETAFLAGVPIIMGYATEFKPYMLESCFVLIVLILYFWYREKRIKWYRFIGLSALGIGFGNPVCFILGGVLLVEFLTGCREKNVKRIRQSTIGGMIIFGIFLMYYLFWLKPVINDGYMVDFWQDYRLEYLGKEEIWHSILLIRDIMKQFGAVWGMISVGFFACLLIVLFYEYNEYIAVILCGMAVALFASSLGMFPLKDRLYLFAYPLMTLLFFHVWNYLWGQERIKNIILLLGMAMLICTQNGISENMKKENLIVAREEIRSSIEYVKEHIAEEEKCYVYWHALPAFWYENGYENLSLGAYQNNLIFGKGFFHHGDNQEDVDQILNSDKMWILISHKNTSGDRYNEMLIQANDFGNLEKVMDNYDTPLYYYTKSKSDRKFCASMEVIEVESDGQVCDAVVRITNTGDACMNNGFETITLRSRNDKEQEIVVPVEGELPIGESIEVPVHFVWTEGVEKVDLYLKREGKFWMDEQGVMPVSLYRS